MARPWTPADLGSRLIAWFDASDAATITQSGGIVSSWANKTGGPAVAQTDAAKRPSYSANSANDRNLPAVLTTGSMQYLTSTNPGVPQGAAPSAMFCAARAPASFGGFAGSMGSPTNVAYASRAIALQDQQRLLDDLGFGNSAVGNRAVTAGAGFIGGIVYDGVNDRFFTNGNVDNTVAVALNTQGTALWLLSLTLYPQASPLPAVQEVIFVSGVLTRAEGEMIEGYLAGRWNLRPNLPAAHPYKTASPMVADGATLTADAASYALVGRPAGLTVARRLVATASAYALIGTATDFRAARRLIATPATYVSTGNAAALTINRRLLASPASYALTGQPASLASDKRLVAVVATYSLTGNPVALTRPGTQTLAAVTGSFSVGASAAGLRAARRLLAAPSTFTLSTSPARLIAARRLAASAAPYVLTGRSATLTVGNVVLDFTVPPGYTVRLVDEGSRTLRLVDPPAHSQWELPVIASTFTRSLDTIDRKPFKLLISRGTAEGCLLVPGYGLASANLRLTVEAEAIGLQILTTGGRAPFVTDDNPDTDPALIFWLGFADELPVLNGQDVEVGIEFTGVSDSNPDDRFQMTAFVKVTQK